MNNTIAAIILTKNEEKHIARCIGSLKDVCDEILVIDSFSTDKTCEIAERLGARLYQHPFENQAKQFNWAIKHCPIAATWIWRVDADEYIEDALAHKVLEQISSVPPTVNGIYVNKKIVFMGRPLLHGGWYPAPQIKIIRNGFGASEDKWMDEHLVVFSGETIAIDGDQTDENLNDLTWWTDKHNVYASREAVNMLMMEYGLDGKAQEVVPKFWGTEEQRKRWLKLKYIKFPLFVRPFINFFIRYVLKGGFLDGKEGFIWHILQGFWYRMLVDAKIFELKKSLGNDKEMIKKYLTNNYL